MSEPVARRLARDLHILAALTRSGLEARSGEPDRSGGLSFLQLSVLRWLGAAGPRRVREVARFLGSSLPAATQVVARLARQRLVIKRAGRRDRRAVEVRLAERGRARALRANAESERRVDRLLGGIEPKEAVRLARAVEAIIGRLLDAGGEPGDACLHCTVLAAPECLLRARGRKCPLDPGDPAPAKRGGRSARSGHAAGVVRR